MTRAGDPEPNFLIASLPKDDLAWWLPLLEPIELPLGMVLYESGCALSHVHFPTTALISLRYVTENGGSAEIAIAGNEGPVGISLCMGGPGRVPQAAAALHCDMRSSVI